MGSYIVTVAGVRMRYVFNHADKNFVGLREMTEALEGAFVSLSSILSGGQASGGAMNGADGAASGADDSNTPSVLPSVEYDEATETSTFRIVDRLACEIKEISFVIKDALPDTVTPRLVTINGSREYIDFVLHDDRNMIGVRDFAKLAGLEGYLQWYDKDGDQYVELRREDPYGGCGGFKEFAEAAVAKQGGAIPSAPAFEYYQTIFDTGYSNPKRNRYSGYVFSFTDAAQWLLQTGGRANFVLQVRDTSEAPDQAAAAVAGQWNIMRQFLLAYDALSRCGYGNAVRRPGFYIGTPEDDVKDSQYGADIVIAIFEGVLQKLREFGYADSARPRIVKGIYFGSETPKTHIDMGAIRSRIDSYGGELVWIPYFIYEKERDEILAYSGYFDKVILQPSTFYYGANAYKDAVGKPFAGAGAGAGGGAEATGVDDAAITGDDNDAAAAKKWNDIFALVKLNPGKFGVELEFDMGLVTGRRDTKPEMSPAEKKRAFAGYVDRLFGPGAAAYGRFPVGIYSGGPNEQGYNNAAHNNNVHNDYNHEATVRPFATGSKYGELYGGNLVYKLNREIFCDKPAAAKRAALLEIINSLG